MRQVPRYLVIGNGRVAKHFKHYLSLLNIPFSSWNKTETTPDLKKKLSQATHALALISDDAINSFIEKNFNENNSVMWIHFSGSLVSPIAIGAHPLMSFNSGFYTLDHYKKIPFILDRDAPEFEKILPGLSNPHAYLDKNLKAKYHALCVLSGNFSCLLWQKLFSDFQKEFNFPESIAHPYLIQQTQNLIFNFKTALTGPLVRNDKNTIEKNLQALDGDFFQEIYKTFVNCYEKIKNEKKL